MSIPQSLYYAYIDLNACVIWAEMSASLEIYQDLTGASAMTLQPGEGTLV